MPSDDLTDYLAALQSATAQQKSAEAQQREQELAHARELAALKAQERAEEERLLKLRIQAAQAEQAAQETLYRREAAAHASEQRAREESLRQAEALRIAEQAEERRREDAAQREAEARRQAQELARQQAEQQRADQQARKQAEQRQREEAAHREAEVKRQAEESAHRQAEQQRLSWIENCFCQWDETHQEYEQRLKSLGLVEVGRFTFNPNDYDVTTGLFCLPTEVCWHAVVPQDCRPKGGLIWKVQNRNLAREAVAMGEMPLLGSLRATGKQFIIHEFAINVTNRTHRVFDHAAERLKEVLDEIIDAMVEIIPGQVSPKSGGKVEVGQRYAICSVPVTQAWYETLMGVNPSYSEGPDLPVESVLYSDAVTFCRKLNEALKNRRKLESGSSFALPTEEQWEFACRAGSRGDYGLLENGWEGSLDHVAWYEGNSDGQSQVVGAKEPNAWGLYDMHGGINEWCDSWEEIPGHERYRVVRGGNYETVGEQCTADFRHIMSADGQNAGLGFRLCLNFKSDSANSGGSKQANLHNLSDADLAWLHGR